MFKVVKNGETIKNGFGDTQLAVNWVLENIGSEGEPDVDFFGTVCVRYDNACYEVWKEC